MAGQGPDPRPQHSLRLRSQDLCPRQQIKAAHCHHAPARTGRRPAHLRRRRQRGTVQGKRAGALPSPYHAQTEGPARWWASLLAKRGRAPPSSRAGAGSGCSDRCTNMPEGDSNLTLDSARLYSLCNASAQDLCSGLSHGCMLTPCTCFRFQYHIRETPVTPERRSQNSTPKPKNPKL